MWFAAAAIAAMVVYALGAFWTCTHREEKGSRVIRRWRNGLGMQYEVCSLLECPITWHDTTTGEVSFLSEMSADLEYRHQNALEGS